MYEVSFASSTPKTLIIVSNKISNPSPVTEEKYSLSFSIIRESCKRSDLFSTVKCSFKLRSNSCSFVTSCTNKVRFALLIISLDLSIPSCSILFSGLFLIPAVSTNSTTSPSKLIEVLTRSLVVPGISEVIATSSCAKKFNREDLPALGGPTIATV